MVYLRHPGTQHFSRFRSKPGFHGDESNPSVHPFSFGFFFFMIQQNDNRKFLFLMQAVRIKQDIGYVPYVFLTMYKVEFSLLGLCNTL